MLRTKPLLCGEMVKCKKEGVDRATGQTTGVKRSVYVNPSVTRSFGTRSCVTSQNWLIGPDVSATSRRSSTPNCSIVLLWPHTVPVVLQQSASLTAGMSKQSLLSKNVICNRGRVTNLSSDKKKNSTIGGLRDWRTYAPLVLVIFLYSTLDTQ